MLDQRMPWPRQQPKQAPLQHESRDKDRGEHQDKMKQHVALIALRDIARRLPGHRRELAYNAAKLCKLTSQTVFPLADMAKHAGYEAILLEGDGGCCGGGGRGRAGTSGSDGRRRNAAGRRSICPSGRSSRRRRRRRRARSNRMQRANRLLALVRILQHIGGASCFGWRKRGGSRRILGPEGRDAKGDKQQGGLNEAKRVTMHTVDRSGDNALNPRRCMRDRQSRECEVTNDFQQVSTFRRAAIVGP